MLLLECGSAKQRDEWYKAVEAGIKAAKETSAQVWFSRGGHGCENKERCQTPLPGRLGPREPTLDPPRVSRFLSLCG